jgi:hypothetical protein
MPAVDALVVPQRAMSDANDRTRKPAVDAAADPLRNGRSARDESSAFAYLVVVGVGGGASDKPA